jgi:hypothetical protein
MEIVRSEELRNIEVMRETSRKVYPQSLRQTEVKLLTFTTTEGELLGVVKKR